MTLDEMMRVLSPIYPPQIKPVRDGWYLCDWYGTWTLRLFQRGEWIDSLNRPMLQWARWRGLAFDPARAFRTDAWVDDLPGCPAGAYVEGVFIPGAQFK